MNIVCPHCQQEHSLFWFVRESGKRELSYRCDRIQILRTNRKESDKGGRPVQELKTINSRFVVEDRKLLKQASKATIPEVWSKKLIRSNQDKAQMKLPI